MVEFRKMTINDYEQALALWERTPGMNLQSLDNTRAGIKRVIDRNPDLCFIAEEQGIVIATILGATDGRKGYFYHVAVAESFQHQQIGKNLISKVLEEFRLKNIEKVGLFTVKDNSEGQKFWEHLGFKERPDIKYLDLDL
ncbi:GNAT family N-acetyltransferase [Liquorilactobacillus mali]|uniref:N-acetyltransferase GCN5 n=1 Tax=Liquorilactobacillus mali KCTC 3596 = DSM 20444 TaxID=1046596 RepID=J0L1J1_9LACO|nr:GNAT family N-acetyltransferase [Liquorilactobacillus mali]EJF01651.1 N-acetyltransferase GCN5 [Liquorilactobacillus mali KCTC 3596 = DSM 20444]KRN07996.1 N-acetyltransferase GCN5 [Liquorilactobacillus mali KCTC 3596 = DSM 20444]MDC7954008.1 GNAT family N-acetyltransferase [Liquorilactobacillus mali]MDV7758564.1 GNAT family N-acetyltransferase [Liquorilactobacillus mali]QFQ75113.1 GNAT family N-acetyltransferase [Liquorilactobacillus mali]